MFNSLHLSATRPILRIPQPLCVSSDGCRQQRQRWIYELPTNAFFWPQTNNILMHVGICHKDGNSERLILNSGSDSHNREDNSSPRVYSIVIGAEPRTQLCPRQAGNASFLTSSSTNPAPWKYNWIAQKPHMAQEQCTGLLKEWRALISEWQHFPYILHINNCTFLHHHRQQTYCTGVNTTCLRCSAVPKKGKH